VDLEDGVEFGDLEEILDAFGEVEEFELAAGAGDGGEGGDKLADAGGVDVGG
jgi:hypothetical protein